MVERRDSATGGADGFAAIDQSGSLREAVHRALSTAIVTGDMVPGTLVTVPRLAKQFEVSPTPVREAMLDLEKRGFVDSVRNKGFRVTAVSEQDLRAIVEVRRLLEVPALRMIADDFPAARFDEFDGYARDISNAAAEGALAEYLAADWTFHRALLELTGNRWIVGLVGELRRQTRMVGLADLRETEELRRSAEEHGQLLGQLMAGRTAEACELLEVHIGHVLGWWAGRAEASPAT